MYHFNLDKDQCGSKYDKKSAFNLQIVVQISQDFTYISFAFSRASPPTRRSPAGKDVTDNYLSPEDKSLKVWPTPIKHLRDEVVRFKAEWDRLLGVQKDIKGGEYLTPEGFVYDPNEEDRMNNEINDSSTLRRLYEGTRLKCLNPSDFRILNKNGRPYMLAQGSKGMIFLAQDNKSRRLVAIKGLKPTVKYSREQMIRAILRELGFTHKGGTILEQDKDILPCYIQGFLKVNPESSLADYYFDIMPVTVLSSLVPDVPMCLPVSSLLKMNSEPGYRTTISNADYAKILSLIVKAMLLLNKGGVAHNDVGDENMCVVYQPQEGQYGLTVLDFGNSSFKDLTGENRFLRDVMDALEIVNDFAQGLNFENTKRFASSIIQDPNRLNRETVLSKLNENLELDLEPIPYAGVEDEDDSDGDYHGDYHGDDGDDDDDDDDGDYDGDYDGDDDDDDDDW